MTLIEALLLVIALATVISALCNTHAFALVRDLTRYPSQ